MRVAKIQPSALIGFTKVQQRQSPITLKKVKDATTIIRQIKEFQQQLLVIQYH